MNGLKRAFERSAERFQPPTDWLQRIQGRRRRKHRNARVGAAIVGVATCALVFGGMFELSRTSRDPASLSPAPPQVVAFHDAFDQDLRLWPSLRTSRFRLGYVGGGYQIDVLRPFEQRYWVRATGEATTEMEVSTVLSTIADAASGWAGVMCVDSLGPDDGYAFTIMGASRGWRIYEVLQGQEPRTLASGSMSSIATGEGTANIVNGRCEALAAGGAKLTITIGGESDSVIDDSGPTGFIGIGMFVRAEGGRTAARFDELTMRRP